MHEMRATVRAMKYVAIALLAAVPAILLTACDTSGEDRQFYYRGWMKPERSAEQRMYGGGSDGRMSVPAER
jgi:hypothetical protein